MIMRTTKPSAGNRFYITTARGGLSMCIQGNPTDGECNVLANCVGYACGRFNEIIGRMQYPSLNCNAESFIERAQSLGLTISQTPSVGAIMCWRKGAAGVSGDGAGHVAVVERVNTETSVYTSESGYGSSAFWNQTRAKGDGNWGLSGSYAFRGFIVNPQKDLIPSGTTALNLIGNPVARDVTKNQIEITIDVLRARSGAYLMENIIGHMKPGIYDVLETKDMRHEQSNGYLWYLTHDREWCAQVDGVTYYTKQDLPKPTQSDNEAEMQKAISAAVEILKPFVT